MMIAMGKLMKGDYARKGIPALLDDAFMLDRLCAKLVLSETVLLD
jgi:hypothetical protein